MLARKQTVLPLFLYVGLLVAAVTLPVLAQPVVKRFEISVTIERITALDAMDYFSPADFYTKISIDNQTFQSPYIQDQNDISPNWQYSKIVTGGGVRYIRIEIWDKDLEYDDLVDVNAQDQKRALDLTLDVDKCEISGDTTGKCDATITTAGSEPKKASLQFRVTANTVDPTLVSQRIVRLKKK